MRARQVSAGLSAGAIDRDPRAREEQAAITDAGIANLLERLRTAEMERQINKTRSAARLRFRLPVLRKRSIPTTAAGSSIAIAAWCTSTRRRGCRSASRLTIGRTTAARPRATSSSATAMSISASTSASARPTSAIDRRACPSPAACPDGMNPPAHLSARLEYAGVSTHRRYSGNGRSSSRLRDVSPVAHAPGSPNGEALAWLMLLRRRYSCRRC